MAGNRSSLPASAGSKISRKKKGCMSQSVRHYSSRVIHIHNRAFEEDLTRDTLNRLIQRIDEEFYMPDEFETENP